MFTFDKEMLDHMQARCFKSESLPAARLICVSPPSPRQFSFMLNNCRDDAVLVSSVNACAEVLPDAYISAPAN
jgi:hypothetical protein